MILKIFMGCLFFLLLRQIHQSAVADHFASFKDKYAKDYGSSSEELFRNYIFILNKQAIDYHNSQPTPSYSQTVNHFADLTPAQFRQAYLGLLSPSPQLSHSQQEDNFLYHETEIDWQKEGKVSRVKDQQMCASCWAFCSIAAVESAFMIQKGIQKELSEQQLVDCSSSYGNMGCRGGELEYTFRYLMDRGIQSEAKYPYIGKQQNCKEAKGPFKIAGFRREITCEGLYRALLKGPVAVAVDAINWSFYKEGIFDDCNNELTHGVLVAGMTQEYWWVKNSWGTEWGIQGYIKVKRGNTCSICEFPFFPLLQ